MSSRPVETVVQDFVPEKAALLANLSIEASAGTGKTYTLEQIVCRLIEHYGLRIQQILLVTYTNKAAEELRQRIRRRLSLRLKERQSSSGRGPVREQDQDHGQAERNIVQALNHYSEANISTIHSFFRQCLEQFALETGQSLAGAGETTIDSNVQPVRELLLDELQKNDFGDGNELYLDIAGPLLAAQSRQSGRTTFGLGRLLEICEAKNLENFWHGHPDFGLVPGEAEMEQLELITRQFSQEQGPVYQAFCQLADCDWAEDAFGKRAGGKVPKSLPQSYEAATALEFFRRLRALRLETGQAETGQAEAGEAKAGKVHLPALFRLLLQSPHHPQYPDDKTRFLAPYMELLCWLHPQNLESNNEKYLEKYGPLKDWKYYDQFLHVQQFLEALAPCLGPCSGSDFEPRQQVQALQAVFAAKFLLNLRRKITPQLRMSQLLHGTRSFTDMVEGLYRVLVLGQYGDSEELLRLLRRQYRCVLVDEFQDTDPTQWQILYRIFGAGRELANSRPLQRSHNFIIVGDPKQSIYRFRGANVRLYHLVQECCDEHYRLSFNYRSNVSVIGASNRIFSAMWGDRGLFTPARAGMEKEQLPMPFLLEPQAESPDSGAFCFLDCDGGNEAEALGHKEKSSVVRESTEAIAWKVADLLSRDYRLVRLPSRKIGGSGGPPESCRPVQPGDIAVLMGRNSDCAVIYQRLQALGIPAQFDEASSVFLDGHARSLHYFLLALCGPRQLDHSLRLLLSPLFGLSVEEANLLLGRAPSFSSNLSSADFGLPSDSEFVLSFTRQLFHWKEEVDQGKLLNVIRELFLYGSIIYRELRVLVPGSRPSPELRKDVYSRILGRARNFAASETGNRHVVPGLGEQNREDNRESYNNLRHLIEILTEEQLQRALDCRELCRFVGQEIKHAKEVLESANSETAEYARQSCNESQAVRIMTIHGSKGLEFPIVLLGIGFSEKKKDRTILLNRVRSETGSVSQKKLHCDQNLYLAPSLEVRAAETEAEYEELQRLFYVGLTRATCKIYLPFHSAGRKEMPYVSLLEESLSDSLPDSSAPYSSASCGEISGLRSRLKTLLSESPECFSLETAKIGKNLADSFADLVDSVRQRLFQTSAEQASAAETTLKLESRDTRMSGKQAKKKATKKAPRKVAENLLFSELHLGEAAVTTDIATDAGIVSEKSCRKLQHDNLSLRFPAVSSFSSLQRSLENGARENVREKVGEKIEEKTEDIGSTQPKLTEPEAYGTGRPQNHPVAYFSPEDSLGGLQDKERDERAGEVSLPDLPDPEFFETPEIIEDAAFEMAVPESNSEQSKEDLHWHELLLSPGADLGNLLHDILEHADYGMIARSGIDDLLQNSHFYEQLSLQSRCYFPRNWIRKAYAALCRMVWHTLHSDLNLAEDIETGRRGTDLPDRDTNPLELCRLSKDQRQHELEFIIAVPENCQLDSELFLLDAGTKIQVFKGFVKGFIDLLFFHEGKLYLLDWKSNLSPYSDRPDYALASASGRSGAEQLRHIQQQLYRPSALQQLMTGHHYRMQYLIYLAVVYYYLKLQYGSDFCYRQHFGGCYYVFLRGMVSTGTDAPGVYRHKPDEELLIRILEGLGIGNQIQN
ncbi:UvrD-helicase domain-containing protein [Candidatus Haliotispira prima]|uniref:RecBCD enzyme subunit RecB n=1 Tax=Candidatus Haliotispira prima TaxID=3034016 RepID=A0ABY8MEU3_9SPIO|nr:UvrD-helicase domain-containing protein [Candidatus Haliotispira prima]